MGKLSALEDLAAGKPTASDDLCNGVISSDTVDMIRPALCNGAAWCRAGLVMQTITPP